MENINTFLNKLANQIAILKYACNERPEGLDKFGYLEALRDIELIVKEEKENNMVKGIEAFIDDFRKELLEEEIKSYKEKEEFYKKLRIDTEALINRKPSEQPLYTYDLPEKSINYLRDYYLEHIYVEDEHQDGHVFEDVFKKWLYRQSNLDIDYYLEDYINDEQYYAEEGE